MFFLAAFSVLAGGFLATASTGPEVLSLRNSVTAPTAATAIAAAATVATAPAAAPDAPPPADVAALPFPGVGTWLQSAPTSSPARVSVSVRMPASRPTGSHRRYEAPTSSSMRLAVLHESHSSRCFFSQTRSASSTGSPSWTRLSSICARSHSSEVATTDATAPAVMASRSFERARQINWAAAFSEIPIVSPISS